MGYDSDVITKGFEQFWSTMLEWLPRLVGALLILIVGVIVASALSAAARKLLYRLELGRRLHRGQGGGVLARALPQPERFIAKVVYWVIMLGVISLAIQITGIPGLTDVVAAIYSYLPNVIAAIIIFVVAGAVAAGVSAVVSRTMGDTPTGKIVGTAVPFVVMGIATFMILDQLQISPAIVTITYGALMGAAALGLALAFGLGGRDVAAKLLSDAYIKGMEQREQVKQDMRQGAERARAEAQQAVERRKRRR